MSVAHVVSNEALARLSRTATHAVRKGDQGVMLNAADVLALCREVSTLRRHKARLSEAGWGAIEAMQDEIEKGDLADDGDHDLYHPQQALKGSLEQTDDD